MAVTIGIIIAVVAVLLIHMDRKKQGNMIPISNLPCQSTEVNDIISIKKSQDNSSVQQ